MSRLHLLPAALAVPLALLLFSACGRGEKPRGKTATPAADKAHASCPCGGVGCLCTDADCKCSATSSLCYASLRPFPEKFPRRSHLPDLREVEASGPISNSLFSAGRDLVYVDDDRVWWESDNDGETDDECDHSMHRDTELPFRRLVELCVASNATLRVQEAYRPSGIHATLSLHKEGRALDLTCPMLDPDNPNPEKPTPKSLEILAKFAWAAGFDWVLYECPRNSGPHIHASVKRKEN